ncbi:MAG: SDR family NAD(P)-dependent oxidoreductase, partial [Thiohalocapsa sp.]
MAVGLRHRLEQLAGIPVPAAALFAHPTVNRLAGWLAGERRDVPLPASRRDAAGEAIAIVGLACRLPGGIATPADFLALLSAGREAIGDFPAVRPTAPLWDAAAGLASRRGGFLDAVDRFDAAFFRISPREAVQLDPQQRLLLEVAWEALEDAGIAPDRLDGSRTGVFVGATGSDYAALARRAGAGALDAHSLVGQPSNTLAGRLAYQFGLTGPALTVDTACSSSLVALHLAIAALRRGEAESALVGGVNLILTPDVSVMLSEAGVLSKRGECRPFDAAADGYVRGEAVGVVVLKPLATARRDGDRVLAVVKGSAVNHDGRSSSFTAPNGAAQTAVIRAALADAGLGPGDIDYIEAHGTGTALGDPVELDALADVFADGRHALHVGSVKAAVGHTEAAAGIVSVIKAVLCLRAGRLMAQVNFARRNALARDAFPVVVTRPDIALRDGALVGVSALGASGTNAHVVLAAGETATEAAMRRVALPLTRFEPQRYWLPETARPPPPALLGEPRRSARSGEVVREGRLDPALPWLRDHIVNGATLLPAAGFVTLCALAGIAALTAIEFRRPLEIPPDGVAIQLVEDRDNGVALYAETADGWSEIAAARIARDKPSGVFADAPGREAAALDGAAFTRELAGRGFEFGPAYHLVTRLERDGRVAAAAIDGPPDSRDAHDPATLDAALQALTSLLPAAAGPSLPARIEAAWLQELPHGRLTARARLRLDEDSHAVGDALIEDASGHKVAVLQGVELRPLPAQPGLWFHDVVWRPATASAAVAAGHWHAIGPGAAGLGLASADEAGDGPLPAAAPGIVDLRPLTAATPQACIAATAALVRAAARMTPPPQLVMVSRSSSTAPPVLPGEAPAAAVLMGMQPVIAAEHPELRCRWLDLDPDEPGLPPLTALAGPAGRFALRQGRLLAPEIVKAMPEPAPPLHLAPGPDRSLAELAVLSDAETPPPGSGEVQIRIAAAGLNFKDALTALGRAAAPLGLECAGEVIAVGAGVDRLAPGDPVLAFAPGALATHVNVSAATVLRRPDWLDEDGAASLPVAALTAWHGLVDIAGLRPGARVLVHAGAGGVGAMAVALATALGGHVFATASAGKERAALAAGAELVGDSRSIDFVEAARAWAGEFGFDIVLNALGSEIAQASAELLRPDGVFLEIGNASPPAVTKPIHHVAYDLTMPIAADPGWFADRLQRVLDMLQAGHLPLPRRTSLPLAAAGAGLRALADGATIGKLVVRLPRPLAIRGDASYLVTGGAGAVGHALARQLKLAGAGEVVLLSRPASAHSDFGPDFRTVAADVTDADAVAAVLRELPRLNGVIHAAGALHDRTLAALTDADIAAATAAKIAGAGNLDRLTRDRRLDFFVLVSSTSGSLAAPGQAAYAAANAWLDRLAASRRAHGLPATAIAFGPWLGGMFARLDAAQRRQIEQSGLRPMPPRRAAAALLPVLASGAVHRLVMDRAPAAEIGASEPASRIMLLQAAPAERPCLLRDELARRLTALLGLPAGAPLDPRRALRDLGLDSLLSVSLRNELAGAFGVDLPSTLLFDYPTLEALAAFLLPFFADPGPADEPPPERSELAALGESELAALLERELDPAS